mmetsp:Transcript_973/g.1380  ORF Transcript_973/g.1380 Transcript_973/m.1380 type:complete len:316 (-) Transcript_973:147-1094(-)
MDVDLTFIDPALYLAHSDASDGSTESRKRKIEDVDGKDTNSKAKKFSPGIDRRMIRTSILKEGKGLRKRRWIKCHHCEKWRRICTSLPFESLVGWKCSQNVEEKYSSCKNAEEKLRKREVVLTREEEENSYKEERREFCMHVKAFLRKHGYQTARRPPLLGGKELDLYRLYREVLHHGGYDQVVSKPGTWSKIFRTLENSESRKVTDASYRLKWYYTESLYAYEQFYFRGADVSTIRVPLKPKRGSSRKTNTWHNIPSRNFLNRSNLSASWSNLNRHLSPWMTEMNQYAHEVGAQAKANPPPSPIKFKTKTNLVL